MFLYINSVQTAGVVLVLINNQGKILEFKKIKARRKQSEKLLVNIEKILGRRLKSLKGVIVVKGPGSFTALRIGLTTANMLAWSLSVPIVGVELKMTQSDRDLIEKGYRQVVKKKRFKAVWPEYGREPNITIKK